MANPNSAKFTPPIGGISLQNALEELNANLKVQVEALCEKKIKPPKIVLAMYPSSRFS